MEVVDDACTGIRGVPHLEASVSGGVLHLLPRTSDRSSGRPACRRPAARCAAEWAKSSPMLISNLSFRQNYAYMADLDPRTRLYLHPHNEQYIISRCALRELCGQLHHLVPILTPDRVP